MYFFVIEKEKNDNRANKAHVAISNIENNLVGYRFVSSSHCKEDDARCKHEYV
jgi:hypothetical protein